MRLWTPLLLLAAALVLAVENAEVAEEIPRILESFSHEQHAESLEEQGLGCPACHQVGSVGEAWEADRLSEVYVAPPSLSCHFCHNPEKRKASAPDSCGTCHEGSFKPESHGLAWEEDHGAEVRLFGSECTECHETATCLSCHEQRGAMSDTPHLPGWGSLHGVEARFDPDSCVVCHSGDTCESCHSTGRAPW